MNTSRRFVILPLALFAVAVSLAAASPTTPKTSSIVIAGLQDPLNLGSALVTVHLRRASGPGSPTALYKPFTSYGDSLALSRDGRWLAYTDRQFQLHLVSLSSSRDRVLGKGIWAAFSATAHYLAYVTGSIMPINTPGPQGHLMVYDMTTARKTRVGPKDPLLSDFAWSPQGDRLAWQIHLLKDGAHQQRPDPRGPLWMYVAPAAHPSRVTVMRPPGRLGDLVSGKGVEVREDGSPTWSADGKSVLYWKYASSEPSSATYRWQLMSWRIPTGPAHVLWTTRAAFPNDMVPPPPVVSGGRTVIASLLGGPNRQFGQLTLYSLASGRTLAVKLPGEPRQLTFAPGGRQLLVIWDKSPDASSHVVRRAALVDTMTGKVQDLGGALQAFWATTP